MNILLLDTEAGIILHDLSNTTINSIRFSAGREYEEHKDLENPDSELNMKLHTVLKELNISKITLERETYLSKNLSSSFEIEINDKITEELNIDKLTLMLECDFFKTRDDLLTFLRTNALKSSHEKIHTLSTKTDLQIIQAISTLDELDKYVNIAISKIKEWYGLHFPELDGVVHDSVQFIRFTSLGLDRNNVNTENISVLELSGKKTEHIIDRAFDSKGGDIRDEDLKIISVLSEVTISEIKTRDHLEKYVKKEMNTLAPNISSIAGENIGARLIAKAGSLEKLARLPSSTIQILGAEKALFRALKTGSKPPKHGILFQHDDIHAAPKWQRGKIARTLASKIAIAARVDAYRGVKMDGSIETSLKNRIDEIKKLKKPKFKKSDSSFVADRSSRGSLRDDKPRYKQYSKYGKIKRRSQSVYKSDRRSKYEKSSTNTKDLRRSKAHNKSKRHSKSGRKTQS
mgnify:CR=1 FL=1